jgi:hypothetical protein
MRRLPRLQAGALGAALLLFGCESTCPRETEKVATPYEAGNTNAHGTLYETNGWDEPFVDFPAGRRLALHHGLVDMPVEIRSYVAFKPDPFPEDETRPGFVAESAGNQVLIERVDDVFIQVRNDTCEHFYLRLVASADSFPTTDGAGGGGTNAGGAGGAGGVPDELAGAGGG